MQRVSRIRYLFICVHSFALDLAHLTLLHSLYFQVSNNSSLRLFRATL